MTHAEPSLSETSAATRTAIPSFPSWAMVIVAVVSVQIGAAIAKSLFATAGPSGVVFLRTLLAAVMFLAVWRPGLRGFDRRAWVYIAAYGFMIATMMLAFYAAIDRIPLGITVAIAFAGPLSVAVLGSRRAADFVWVGLAAVGILLLSPITNVELDPVGMLLALASALTWALYILLTKRISQTMPGNATLALAMCVAALVALPFGINGAVAVLAHPGLLALSLIVALLSSAIPFWLEFKAMNALSPRAFGLLVSLEPVVAAVIGVLLLSESVGLREVVGIGLVTIAAVATTRAAA